MQVIYGNANHGLHKGIKPPQPAPVPSADSALIAIKHGKIEKAEEVEQKRLRELKSALDKEIRVYENEIIDATVVEDPDPERTYEVVKAELDSVDLEDTPAVNKLLAEMKRFEHKPIKKQRKWRVAKLAGICVAGTAIGGAIGTIPTVLFHVV